MPASSHPDSAATNPSSEATTPAPGATGPDSSPTAPTATPAPEGRRPLWAQVQASLEERIEAGEFAEEFPGELELSKQYEVSRSTIRAALTPLRRMGIISAQPGKPSQVVHASRDHAFGPIYSLFTAVEGAGMTQRSTVRSAGMVIDAEAADHLSLAPSTELVHISRMRYADDEPFAEDQVWLTPDARDVLDFDLSHGALYEALKTQSGLTLTAGHEVLHSINLSPEQAKLLDCDPGDAAFYIERLGTVDDRPVEWRKTLIRGDRFTVTTTFP